MKLRTTLLLLLAFDVMSLNAFAADVEAPLACEIATVIAPSSAESKNSVTINNDAATFSLKDAEGELSFVWNKPSLTGDSWMGGLSLTPQKVPGNAAEVLRWEWGHPSEQVELVDSQWSQQGNCATLTINYKAQGKPVKMTVLARMQGKALVFDVAASDPLFSSFDAGKWQTTGKKIRPPFSPFDIWYYPQSGLFTSAYYDWTVSNASGQKRQSALYDKLTDGRRNNLRERFVIAASWHINETFPHTANKQSLYFQQVAGKPVLDIWQRDFRTIEQQLRNLATYNLSDCIILVHVWQHYGFDIGLPMHYPAFPKMGGDEGLKRVVQAGRDMGCYVALHENYMMTHPTSPLFDESLMAKSTEGKRVEAYLNDQNNQWGYLVRPSAMIQIAKTQSPEIHTRYGTNAAFLDVNSSKLAWADADMNAVYPGAGMYRAYNAERMPLWNYLRNTHGGPIFGEGGWGQFFWAGDVDGVEAQTFLEQKGTGPKLPLMVDFDLNEIHPLQVNHGMSYFERWSDKREDSINPFLADAYRMQEVVFGHAPFLNSDNWAIPAFALAEFEQVGPVARQTNLSKVKSVSYQLDGQWTDADAAARAGNWTRVKVVYENGLTVIGNSAESPLVYEGYTLPQYGWAALGAGLTAYTALQQGLVVDYAATKDSLYASARNLSDYPEGGIDIKTSSLLSREPLRVNASARVVDFGAIRTNGTVALHRDKKGTWVLRPLDRHRNFILALNADKFPVPPVVHINAPDGYTVTPVKDGKYWSFPLYGSKAYYW